MGLFIDIDFVGATVSWLCGWSMIWMLVQRFRFQRTIDTTVTTFVTLAFLIPLLALVRIPTLISIIMNCIVVVLGVLLVYPTYRSRIEIEARERNAKHEDVVELNSETALKRIESIVVICLLPSIVSLLGIRLNDQSYATLALCLMLLAVCVTIYHFTDRNFHTVFLALVVNTLIFSIQIILIFFESMLNGQASLVDLQILPLIPIGIIWLVQRAITKTLVRTRLAKTDTYVINMFSALFWAYFVIIIVLADVSMALTFLTSQNVVEMLLWGAPMPVFVLYMFMYWGVEVKSLKLLHD